MTISSVRQYLHEAHELLTLVSADIDWTVQNAGKGQHRNHDLTPMMIDLANTYICMARTVATINQQEADIVEIGLVSRSEKRMTQMWNKIREWIEQRRLRHNRELQRLHDSGLVITDGSCCDDHPYCSHGAD